MTTDHQEEVETVARALRLIERKGYGPIGLAGTCGQAADLLDRLRSAPASAWRPIETAPKDRSVIWASLYIDLSTREGRPDLERWNGLQVPLRHPGLANNDFDAGWNIAAPVGHGGFPDKWIAGWVPLRAPPPSTSDAGHRQVWDEKESGS